MKKVLKGLLTALFTLPLLTGGFGASLVKADDTANKAADQNASPAQTVNIDLHKLVFNNGEAPTTPLANDGLTKPEFANTSVPLNGAEFTMYDVTAKYNQLLAAGKSAKEAVAAIQQQDGVDVNKVTTVTTAGQGVAHFADVPLSNNGAFAAYLFVETKVPSGVTDKATPLVIAMPVYNSDVAFMKGNTAGGNDLSTINLYPKNEANELVKKEKDDQVLSYTVGEKVGYKVTVNVPADATKTFQVTDKPSVGLQVLLDDTFVVKSDGFALASGTDYTVVKNADNGGYTFNLVTSSNWIGKQITIDYNMEVTSQAVTDSGLVNNVSVDTDTKKDQKPAQPTPNIFTGGYNFVKKDGNSSTPLVGVEFQVKDKDGNVLSFIKNANNEWVIADSTATGASATISTQTDGKLAINGLKTGDYTLVETKTLDGYVLPANPNTAFKVVTNEAGAGTYTATKGDAAGVVTNVKKGILPSTGGTGIYAFLTIGAALMIGAIVWYKKSKDSAEV